MAVRGLANAKYVRQNNHENLFVVASEEFKCLPQMDYSLLAWHASRLLSHSTPDTFICSTGYRIVIDAGGAMDLDHFSVLLTPLMSHVRRVTFALTSPEGCPGDPTSTGGQPCHRTCQHSAREAHSRLYRHLNSQCLGQAIELPKNGQMGNLKTARDDASPGEGDLLVQRNPNGEAGAFLVFVGSEIQLRSN